MVNNHRSEEELKDTSQISLESVTTLQGIEVSSAFDPIQRIEDGFNFFKINEFKYASKILSIVVNISFFLLNFIS